MIPHRGAGHDSVECSAIIASIRGATSSGNGAVLRAARSAWLVMNSKTLESAPWVSFTRNHTACSRLAVRATARPCTAT